MTTRPYTVERNAMNEQTDRITLLERRVEELERRAQTASVDDNWTQSTPEQRAALMALLANMTPTTVVLTGQDYHQPAPTITVGDEGDPVRVELTLDGSTVRMKVLHTDKSLLGQGTIYEADGLQLCSECGPALELTVVWLWGRVSKYDSSVGVMSFASPAYAIEYRTRVAAFIAGFNASQRKPAAKPEPAAPTLLEAAKEWSCQWAPNEMPCMMADRKLLAAIAQEEAKGKYVCCPECGTRGTADRFVRVDSMAGPCRNPMADAWQARAEKAEAKLRTIAELTGKQDEYAVEGVRTEALKVKELAAQVGTLMNERDDARAKLAKAEADLATAKTDGDLAWRFVEAYAEWWGVTGIPWDAIAKKYSLPPVRTMLDARKKGT